MDKYYQCIFDDRVYCDRTVFRSCDECDHYDSSVHRSSYLDIYDIYAPDGVVISCEVDEESDRILIIYDP